MTVYAYSRVGYHRSLDLLRRNGWKGHGPVPWEHEPNRGFLTCLGLLALAAQAIGETESACAAGTSCATPARLPTTCCSPGSSRGSARQQAQTAGGVSSDRTVSLPRATNNVGRRGPRSASTNRL